MADYGVPNELEGALPWGWAVERLARCRNFWVTTVDARHRPHSMPVWGVWSESDERFFFCCAPSSLKARNLAENPNVVVAVDDTVEVVSLEGVAGRLAVGSDADRYIAPYVAKYEPDPVKAAAMTKFVAENSMFSVTPHRAFAVIEREEDFGPKATRWVWDQAGSRTVQHPSPTASRIAGSAPPIVETRFEDLPIGLDGTLSPLRGAAIPAWSSSSVPML